jgi:NAD dependent epimerase/dehydratase family enzyme
VMGRPSWIPVPSVAMRLLFGEMASVLLEGQRVVPKRLLNLGFQFRFPAADSALQDLLS